METKQIIDLDTPLIHFGVGDACFTIRDAVAGLSILGNTSSGKTSGSGANFIKKYLQAGMGGLVLTVKPDERKEWIKYFIQSGRKASDLIIIEPGGKHKFNFLEYISKETGSERPITENIVEVLNTVIRAEEDKQAKGDDAFWEGALTTLIGMVTDLALIAYSKLTVDLLYNIVQTLPRPNDDPKNIDETKERTAFQAAYALAQKNINTKIDKWWRALSEADKAKFTDRQAYEDALFAAVPDARLSNYLVEYFWSSFRFLSPKTRSIVEFIFSGFLYSLLRDPVYSLFCKGESTVKPEDCFEGKVILLNLPIKVYHKAGRHCQTLFKYIWQRAVEKRQIDDTSLPVFLWADEAQNTVHEHDSDFLATARSSMVATVFISQNLPNYFAAMGGDRAKYRVNSMLANLSTKIFHNNTCVETNRWASDLIGEEYQPDPSMNISITKDSFTQGQNLGLKLQKVYRPEKFTTLKIGGPKNNYNVEAVIYKQGDPLHKNRNHAIINFKQQFNSKKP